MSSDNSFNTWLYCVSLSLISCCNVSIFLKSFSKFDISVALRGIGIIIEDIASLFSQPIVDPLYLSVWSFDFNI